MGGRTIRNAATVSGQIDGPQHGPFPRPGEPADMSSGRACMLGSQCSRMNVTQFFLEIPPDV
eukprot:COSAG06_NODE_59314_length_274_cov_1.171429_1_plen_61_part_01